MLEFPFQIVGFDLDGTLLDTHEDLAAAVNHALALAGRKPHPTSDMRALIGGGAKKMLERALEQSGGIPQDQFQPLYSALLRYYESHIAVRTVMFPGGEAMLDALASRGVKLAVVTNKFETFAVKLLDELGFSVRFATIIGGDTMGPGRAKPAPDQLYEMIARLGGGKAAFVGDTSYDINAARAAAIPGIAVRFGFNDMPADELGADRVIDHFDDLIPALEGL